MSKKVAINVRIDESDHTELNKEAASEERSLSQHVRKVLKTHVQSKKEGVPNRGKEEYGS